jgi:hypothetical protein
MGQLCSAAPSLASLDDQPWAAAGSAAMLSAAQQAERIGTRMGVQASPKWVFRPY